jgi:MMP 1-O-methyltransferase
MKKIECNEPWRLVDAAHSSAQFNEFRKKFLEMDVKYWLKPDEMALHYGIAAFSEHVPCSVEIGTFEGASALFTLAGIHARGTGKLYTVDPHLGAPPYLGSAPWQFTYDKFSRNVEICGFKDKTVSLITDSATASSIWPAQPITSVLIDADHSYLGCLKDVECWAPKLVDGGLMLIDDVDDHGLVELLELTEDLKTLSSLKYLDAVDGVAVFCRDAAAEVTVLEDLSRLAKSKRIYRPWDMSFVQQLHPRQNFSPEHVGGGTGRQTAYQLSFLSRCEPGDYAVSRSAPAEDIAIVDALIDARGDGRKLWIEEAEIPDASCRFVLCSTEQAALFVSYLKHGGVLIARSNLTPTEANGKSERTRLINAGLEACGWVGQVHWGIWRPHNVSTDAILEYIVRNMQ